MAVTARQHTVRVSESTHDQLLELAEITGERMTTIMARAIEREWIVAVNELANRQWEAILADPELARIAAEEDAELDTLVNEGLEEEPWQ